MSRETQAQEGLTEAIYRDALAWFDGAMERVDEWIAPSERIAQRLLGGGRMQVLGSHGFVCELTGRAGGLACLERWTDRRLTEKDVVLAGQVLPDEMGGSIGNLAAVGRGDTRLAPTLTVYVAGATWLLTQRLSESYAQHWREYVIVDTHIPAGRSLRNLALAQMATVATAWALHAEVYAAVARAGRALATYGSFLETGGKEWFDKYRGKVFNDDITVAPAARGDLARQYLSTCRRQIEAFLAAGEAEQVRVGARRLGEALASGHMAMVLVAGHLFAEDYLIPASLERVIMFGRDFEWRRPCMLHSGDFLLYMAYLDYPEKIVSTALGMGANVITFTAEPNGPTNERQTHICGHWQRWDSVVAVPGSPYKILPTSGVVQTPQWFGLMAELTAAM